MEIFPSPDRNRKTTLFARPSSRFLSRPVEGTGHVQHGAITRSFRFFHLLDPLLVSFQPKFHGKQGGEGRLFRSSCSYSKLQGGKGARDAQRSARRAGQIEAEEGKRALILLRLKLFDPSFASLISLLSTLTLSRTFQADRIQAESALWADLREDGGHVTCASAEACVWKRQQKGENIETREFHEFYFRDVPLLDFPSWGSVYFERFLF